jgi:hypothetical protein
MALCNRQNLYRYGTLGYPNIPAFFAPYYKPQLARFIPYSDIRSFGRRTSSTIAPCQPVRSPTAAPQFSRLRTRAGFMQCFGR